MITSRFIEQNHGIRFMNSGSESPENSAAPHSTLSLTIHFLAPPSPNTKFVRVRPHLLLRRGTLVEYEVGIWDEKGVLLCVGRQAALVRPIKVEALQEMRKKMGRPKMFGEPVL